MSAGRFLGLVSLVWTLSCLRRSGKQHKCNGCHPPYFQRGQMEVQEGGSYISSYLRATFLAKVTFADHSMHSLRWDVFRREEKQRCQARRGAPWPRGDLGFPCPPSPLRGFSSPGSGEETGKGRLSRNQGHMAVVVKNSW